MATLDRWRPFVVTPKTLAFPELGLKGRDFEGVLVSGSGEVRLSTPTDFSFTLTATQGRFLTVLERYRDQRENRYDGLARFRLEGTDADGVEWQGGYTIPNVSMEREAWHFDGNFESLSTGDTSDSRAKDSTELIFLAAYNHPLGRAMRRFTKPTPQSNISTHSLDLLGSTIHFSYERDRGFLTITARHSAELSPPYAENWLAEPFRILLGQMVYPRLAARNLARHSIVWVRPSPGTIPGARFAALCHPDDNNETAETFWHAYGQLLTLIGTSRGTSGHLNFEPHPVTRLYQENILGARGSRWIWALTLAGSVEALARLLKPKELEQTDAQEASYRSIVAYIEAWKGNYDLKSVALGAVHRTREITTRRALRSLQNDGVLNSGHIDAWDNMRNSAMHGDLLSPYSNPKEDKHLVALADTMHRLTRELLRRHASSTS